MSCMCRVYIAHVHAVWQSTRHYSIVYDCIAAFGALYLWTFSKGEAHVYVVAVDIQQYSASNTAMHSKCMIK